MGRGGLLARCGPWDRAAMERYLVSANEQGDTPIAQMDLQAVVTSGFEVELRPTEAFPLTGCSPAVQSLPLCRGVL